MLVTANALIISKVLLYFQCFTTSAPMIRKMYCVLKTETFAKLFFLISCSGLLMYAILAFYTFHTAYSSISQLQKYEDNFPGLLISNDERKFKNFQRDLKNILLWTILNETDVIAEGQKLFIDHNYSYSRCYLTTNKYLLNEDYTQFDAIVFDISLLQIWKKKLLPNSRSNRQKYIFRSTISSDNAPICSKLADNYFNWTWTYKLDSDIFSPFIVVKDLDGNTVAPKAVVRWESNITLIPEGVMMHLKQKKKAMAWVCTNLETRNDRMLTAKKLQRVFKENSLVFDIFGCGEKDCPKEGCHNAVERDYYFYYAPEDSNAIDYVTKQVVVGYTNYAVPIVFGGADYRKFIPEGSYINLGKTSVDKLVALVEYVIRNPKIYYSFHRWRNNYVISEAEKFNGICKICEYLNDENKFYYKSIKKEFRKWWYSRPLFERCYPKGAESYSEVLSYVNDSRLHLKL